MSVTKEKKEEIFKEFGGSQKNTGSIQAQVALFTARINDMTGHLKQNRKDNSTKRSLVRLVGKRKRALSYIAKKDINQYRELIKTLGLRK